MANGERMRSLSMIENDDKTLHYQLGQLTGQVTSLIATVNAQSIAISSLETRLRNSEQDITRIAVKMAFLGITAGGVGSFLINFLPQIIKYLGAQ